VKAHAMRNIVIQQTWSEYPGFVEYLGELGFERVVLGNANANLKGKLTLVWQAIRAAVRLWSHLPMLRDAGIVVACGHFAYVIKLLARLGIIRYRSLFCFAFFVHGPAWFPVFRFLSRMDTARDHYLIFSQWEIDLYADRLDIDRRRMHYLPCGDWDRVLPSASAVGNSSPGDYYFSGGYSNRDYISLIDAFRKIQARLIIICSSSLNSELDSVSLPPNVEVFRDVPSPAFEKYIQHAKAGIICLKHDTGAAGQSVVLRLMRNAKATIISDAGALREYVDEGVTGYRIRDVAGELPSLIARLEGNPEALRAAGKAARTKYLAGFSRGSLAQRLNGILLQTADCSALPGVLHSEPPRAAVPT